MGVIPAWQRMTWALCWMAAALLVLAWSPPALEAAQIGAGADGWDARSPAVGAADALVVAGGAGVPLAVVALATANRGRVRLGGLLPAVMLVSAAVVVGWPLLRVLAALGSCELVLACAGEAGATPAAVWLAANGGRAAMWLVVIALGAITVAVLRWLADPDRPSRLARVAASTAVSAGGTGGGYTGGVGGGDGGGGC